MTEPIAVNPPDYLTIAAGLPAVMVPPGPVHAGGTTPIDAAAAAFGAATNLDLAEMNTRLAEEHADRAGHAADAAQKFTVHEGDAGAQFEDVAAQDDALMAQQAPQGALGEAMQGVTGALSGVLGSVGRLPQGLLQAGQSALSPLISAAQTLGQAGLGDTEPASDLDADLGGAGADFGFGAGGGTAGMGTTPAGDLGPPPLPATAAPTTPAGATISAGAAGPTTGAPAGAAGGPMMPMMPAGPGGHGGKDARADEKRIAAPGIPNGAPVKGRTTASPNLPVTTSVAKNSSLPRITPLKRIAGKDDSSA